jgi:hypothetical protein
MSWSNFPVAEMMLVLVDDTHCESFRFASDAPVWHWQIVQDHLVITTRPGGEVVADLHQPTLDGDVLSVRRGATGACRYQVSWTPAAHTRVLP